MSKQQHAPGDLELVRAFVNTLDIERGTDALATAPDLGAWLSDAGLEPGPPDATPSAVELARAVRVREALRTILLAHNDGSPEPADGWTVLDMAAARARLQVRFDPRRGRASRAERGGRRWIDGPAGGDRPPRPGRPGVVEAAEGVPSAHVRMGVL